MFLIQTFIQSIFPWIVLVHSLLFLIFWRTNRLYSTTTNDYLWHLSGRQRDYIRTSLAVTIAVAAWSSVQIGLSRLGAASWPAVMLGVLYLPAALVYTGFFYTSFLLLFIRSPSQLIRIGQGLGYFRIVLDTALLLGIVLAAAWLRRPPEPGQAGGLAASLRLAAPYTAAPFLAVYLLAWALPLAFPPGFVYRGRRPEKPRVIAHRGASMLAPENTIAAARRAAGLGAYGLETDLHLSLDGVPFLMHDDTLRRTTNVAGVFPGRENDRAETFTLAEIRQLDAGSWFILQDPFRTIAAKTVTREELAGYRRLPVPTLAEELELVREAGMVLIFDLNQPPEGHPFREPYFDIVFQRVKEAGIDSQVWYLENGEQAKIVRAVAPRMKLAFGLDYRRPVLAGELLAGGYGIVNSDFGLSRAWIRAYQKAGLWVNLFTVDEPWHFSRLWLLGVSSVTTNNAGTMLALGRPVWGLPYAGYLALWSLLGLLGLGLALLRGLF